MTSRRRELFISYKTGKDDGLNFTANAICKRLEDEDRYEVWIDQKLNAGELWNAQIYEAIHRSDVFLLLLSEQAVESSWVQREVAVAKGSKLSIIPVLIRTVTDIDKALKAFDLINVQYVDLRDGTDAQYRTLFTEIDKIKGETAEQRKRWLQNLREEAGRQFVKAEDVEILHTYTIREKARPTKIHLATGDMSRFKKIDVLVNTENNYMQMVRVFDTGTVSAALRREGACWEGGFVDTVQNDLTETILIRGLPLPLAEATVIPTHAGHEKSRLVSRHIRYIFHVVTVNAQRYARLTRPLEPIKDNEGIHDAVHNCLEKALELDNLNGVFSPEVTARHAQEVDNQASYEPIRSICFPTFGTGHGGRPFKEVFEQMVEGVRTYLLREGDETNLTDIHLCVYNADDLEDAERVLGAAFEQES